MGKRTNTNSSNRVCRVESIDDHIKELKKSSLRKKLNEQTSKKVKLGKNTSKKIKLGNTKLQYHSIGGHKRLHINLGRVKNSKGIHTNTLYSSIGSRVPYFEIWQDKKGKTTVGLEIIWD